MFSFLLLNHYPCLTTLKKKRRGREKGRKKKKGEREEGKKKGRKRKRRRIEFVPWTYECSEGEGQGLALPGEDRSDLRPT